jgi:ABC-type nitrate/sulfonate/bicarbonate transport system substrate-binding protein
MKSFFAAAILMVIFAVCYTAAAAHTITINYPTRTGQIWALYIAKEGGYYAKYGYDVRLAFGVHPAGIAMLVSNEAVMTPYTLEGFFEQLFGPGIKAEEERKAKLK